jgi:hypothetical protein
VEETSGLKHCGITFEGSQFVVYIIEPISAPLSSLTPIIVHPQLPSVAGAADIDALADALGTPNFVWHGCEMGRLAQGDCNNPRDVHRLQGWVNEIHRWGLTEHANKVQTDIKVSLADDGIDTSALDVFMDK